MVNRKTQYGWMVLGGLICLFGMVLACKLRDGNRARAQQSPPTPKAAEPAPPPAIEFDPAKVDGTKLTSPPPPPNLVGVTATEPPAVNKPESPKPPDKGNKPEMPPPLDLPQPASLAGPPPSPKDSGAAVTEAQVPPPPSLTVPPPGPVAPAGFNPEPTDGGKPSTALTPPPATPKGPPPPAAALSGDAPMPPASGLAPAPPPLSSPPPPLPSPAAPPTAPPDIKSLPGEPPLAPPPGPVQTYQARGGETMRDVARRTLGSAERWTDVHKLNPTLKPDTVLSAGATVRLPGEACVQPDDPEVRPLPAMHPKAGPAAPKAVLPLTGTYPANLDDKKAMTLPAGIREQLAGADTVLISPGPDQCLWLTNQVHLERLAQRLEQSPAREVEVRVFKRLYFAQTEKAPLNPEGRVTISERLAQFAGLHQEVVLVGIDDHFELWDAARWRQYTQQKSAARNTGSDHD